MVKPFPPSFFTVFFPPHQSRYARQLPLKGEALRCQFFDYYALTGTPHEEGNLGKGTIRAICIPTLIDGGRKSW